jgi:serine/threonine-protein kinase
VVTETDRVGGEHVYLVGLSLPAASVREANTEPGELVDPDELDYAAPEVVREDDDAGPRTDVYRLGCMVFEMVTGKVPYAGGSQVERLWGHASDEPPPSATTFLPELPAATDAVLAKAMAKQPADRYDSPSEFAEALLATSAL